MGSQSSKKVRVMIEQIERTISFKGSSIQKLVEAVKNSFADVLDSSRISHLQYWDKNFEEYVDVTDISELKQNSSEPLTAVMKKIVLVEIEQNKRKVPFYGSSIQELTEAVRKAFADIPDSSRISHLQYWHQDYEDYVDIRDISEIWNNSGSKLLTAVLKVHQPSKMAPSMEVLVKIGQNKKIVSFDGSSIQQLIEAVKRAFADTLDSSKISHLQYWNKDITDISKVQNKSKLTAVLKKADDKYEPAEVDVGSLSLVPYCTQSMYDGPSSWIESETEGGVGGLALKRSLWVRQSVLFVHFMNKDVLREEKWMCDDDVLNIDNILSWAEAWNNALCPAIPKFVITDDMKKAHIRVKFSGGRCVSLVGRSAMDEDKSKPTMTLALKGLDPIMQKFLVIHEFGHALGLEHEHQRSNFWNHATDLLDIDRMRSDPNLKGVNFERDILKKVPTSDDIADEYDPDSVMHYWFDIRWLKNKDYRDLKRVEADEMLTDNQKRILRGIHKRNKTHIIAPSAEDLKFLQKLYGGQVPRVSPGTTSEDTATVATAPRGEPSSHL